MKLKVFLTMIFLLMVVGYANAGFVKTDLFAPGDQLMTWDTDTNLEWLDLSFTKGQSYNTVLSFTSSNSLRFATTDEFVTLASDFGITTLSQWSTDYYTPAQNFYAFLGSGYADFNAGFPLIAMLDSNGVPLNKVRTGEIWKAETGNKALGQIKTSYNNRSTVTYASFLVRDYTPVPVPGAIWLFGSGIIGLTMVRRKRYSI